MIARATNLDIGELMPASKSRPPPPPPRSLPSASPEPPPQAAEVRKSPSLRRVSQIFEVIVSPSSGCTVDESSSESGDSEVESDTEESIDDDV